MIPWIICSIFLSLIIVLILSSSPLTSGLLILLMAISAACLYGMLISSWFAFLIFLIYVGGILVIFSYFVALTPNQEKITLRPQLFLLPTLLLIFLYQLPSRLHPFSSHHIHTLYTSNNTTILILLRLLLLLAIIIIVKITNLTKGPLRPFSSYV